MRTLIATSLIATSVLSVLAVPASADDIRCQKGVEAVGKASSFEGSPEGIAKFNVEARARARATAAWKTEVRDLCPHYSVSFVFSTGRSISCEPEMGGKIYCTISARPRVKFFG